MQRPELKDHEEKLEEILLSIKLEIIMDRRQSDGKIQTWKTETLRRTRTTGSGTED